jgi:glycosyltransferase involved in cell wall biosynthesis
MRIVIDCRWIYKKTSGVGLYTRELTRALLDLDADDEFILLFDNDDILARERSLLRLDERTRVRTALVAYGPFSIHSTLRMPRRLRRLGADVYHSTNFMLPPRRLPCAAVATIHDLIPFVAPHYIPRSKKTRLFGLYRWVTRRAAHLADRIIAVSEHTKRDIVDHLRVADQKVAVIHNGIGGMFRPPDGQRSNALRTRYGIDGELIVAAGRADPYKNVIAFVRAVERLVKAGRNTLHCLLIGEPDERYPEVRRYVEANGLGRHVRFTGYLDDDAFVAAYQEADLVVHPSLYEGFGFPPVEAMACGTPVVASNRTSMPEVLGDAALLVDPENVDELAAAIVRALDDGALRDTLRAKGLERAARFTWASTATATLDVYHSAVEAHRQR